MICPSLVGKFVTMQSVILLVFFLTSCHALMFMDVLLSEWELFKVEHEKKYANVVEEKFRMKIYMENKKKIAEHNARYENGEVDFALGMNKYGDLMQHEFVDMMNGFNRMGRVNGKIQMSSETGQDSAEFISPANVQIPDSIDWRKKGAVTPVKDQGQCGSCWAFSTTGSLEGQHFRSTKKLVSLSEQNLVDCSGRFGNMGCEGGTMDNAFKYIKYNRGIDSETFYPYNGADGSCHYNPKGSGATDVGYTDIQHGNEQKLMEAVATVGPVSVAIDASSDKFQFYTHGVYYDNECGNDESDLDHGVLVVGYGTMQKNTGRNGTDYWIVKNSWGRSWGDQGYILMSRNRNNNCGIATLASYPLV